MKDLPKSPKLIKRKREACLMSIREMAKKLGISRQTWLNYESGKNPPPSEVWELMKKFLALKGTIVDYWGREQKDAGNKKYPDDARCKIAGCKERPVSTGYCTRHYQRERMRKMRQKDRIRKEAIG
jgi:transcriptional regulator with XRE-family HTH domain